ncbi:ER membrane protein complex subunit 3-like [Mya arenaria]|uniref:ER membrane protein complex subunit 3-like n=1 Tax=Mya arenaria TaxID=6604 RepID=UPI0022E553AA|nr:ER membrane protein complex subunit 3-like [Mya arenaria]
MAELLLDSDIRLWVFLPIVIITFLVGIIRHYVTILLSSEKKTDISQVRDSHTLIRSRLLRENGKYIPKDSFHMRKSFLNAEDKGLIYKLKSAERETPAKNPMTDPSMMTDMLKGNVTNMLPMLIIGGWINWAFSGFLTTKVPFPLTFRFKPMLQRGVELISLDASWVSSASWYFLNVFGLRSMYTLILGQDNAADQTKAMQEQFSGQGMAGPQDPQKAFKAEWEALEITNHTWALEGVEEDVTGQIIPPETIYIKDKFA